MASTILIKCFIIIVILTSCRSSPEKESDNHIRELYKLLQKAVNDTHNNTNIHSLSRRVFVHESEYQIHINKLKEVNGFKMHNVVIKRPETNSTIYINNPLESKLPHPFMSLDEFKNAIIEQRLKDRDKFEKSKNQDILRSAKSTVKFKFTPRKKILKTHNVVTTVKKITTKPGTTTTSIKEKTNVRNVKNVSKTITTKILTRSTEVKRNTPIAFTNTHKPYDNNNSKKLNVNEHAANKSFVSSDITAETKVKVNSLEIAKVIAGTTNIQTPNQDNNTVSSEKSVNANDTILNISQKATSATHNKVVPIPIDEDTVDTSKIETKAGSIDEGKLAGQGRKQSINTDDEEETVILKETAIANATNIQVPENNTVSLEKSENLNDTITVDENIVGNSNKESTSFEHGQLFVDEKQLVNKVYGEEINEFDETTTEATTTTITTPRVKWSRPRVFLGKQPNEESKD